MKTTAFKASDRATWRRPRTAWCVAKAAGVSRESLYRTLSRRGNPKIDTVMELLRALGLKLTIERHKAA